MPTDHMRTQITHTPEVQRSLEVARLRWPDERPDALLLHLIAEGTDAVARSEEVAAARHRERVTAAAGAFDGLYGPDYLGAFRQDWPA